MLFKNRQDAGQKLAEKLKKYKGKNTVILAIPNGGVPVGFEIAKNLDAVFDVMIVRKIQLPWDTEGGFGACSSENCTVLNNEMIVAFGLTPNQIEKQKLKTLEKIKEREEKYRKGRKFPSIVGKVVVLVDDGLASGYTMIVACRTLRNQKPKKIIVAVPCASKEAYERVKPEADEIISLNIKSEYPFAVAEFYKNWYDVGDEEVLKYLRVKPQ
jgi:predicted phosphoribosyltransferase